MKNIKNKMMSRKNEYKKQILICEKIKDILYPLYIKIRSLI